MADVDLELPEEIPGSMRAFVQLDEEETPELEHDPESIEFDPRMKEPFTGMVWIGYKRKEVSYLGHKFVFETPDEITRLEVGVIHKKYANTVSAEAAWAACVLAAYLQSVDGEDLPQPIKSGDTGLGDKFIWVLSNLKHPVINFLYEETLVLDYEINQMLEELERTSKEMA